MINFISDKNKFWETRKLINLINKIKAGDFNIKYIEEIDENNLELCSILFDKLLNYELDFNGAISFIYNNNNQINSSMLKRKLSDKDDNLAPKPKKRRLELANKYLELKRRFKKKELFCLKDKKYFKEYTNRVNLNFFKNFDSFGISFKCKEENELTILYKNEIFLKVIYMYNDKMYITDKISPKNVVLFSNLPDVQKFIIIGSCYLFIDTIMKKYDTYKITIKFNELPLLQTMAKNKEIEVEYNNEITKKIYTLIMGLSGKADIIDFFNYSEKVNIKTKKGKEMNLYLTCINSKLFEDYIEPINKYVYYAHIKTFELIDFPILPTKGRDGHDELLVCLSTENTEILGTARYSVKLINHKLNTDNKEYLYLDHIYVSEIARIGGVGGNIIDFMFDYVKNTANVNYCVLSFEKYSALYYWGNVHKFKLILSDKYNDKSNEFINLMVKCINKPDELELRMICETYYWNPDLYRTYISLLVIVKYYKELLEKLNKFGIEIEVKTRIVDQYAAYDKIVKERKFLKNKTIGDDLNDEEQDLVELEAKRRIIPSKYVESNEVLQQYGKIDEKTLLELYNNFVVNKKNLKEI